jgi:hypothetical protein
LTTVKLPSIILSIEINKEELAMSYIPEYLMEYDREIIDTAVELIDGCFEKETIVNAVHEAMVDYMFHEYGDSAELDGCEDDYEENFAMGYVEPYTNYLVFEHLYGLRIPTMPVESY